MQASRDMVYSNDRDIAQSGGMRVNSILLRNGSPLGYGRKDGTVGGALGDLAVPAGLIYLQEHLERRLGREAPASLRTEPVPDSLYDKLMGIDAKKRKGKTRKKRSGRSKKTRKN